MKSLSFIFALILGALALPAQSTDQLLDQLMAEHVSKNYFSGAVLVARHGDIMYQKAFGYADREKQIPNRPDTRFNLCSMGKTMTATLVMQLVEQGKIALDRPIGEYLPEYPIPNAANITVHHLLTHSSGLNNYMAHPRYEEKLLDLPNLDSVMMLVVDMPLVFDTPGERFEYSNSGFIVLGKLIEKMTGEPYFSCLKKKFLDPLGMDRTWARYPVNLESPREAVPYYTFSPKKVKNAAAEEWPAFSDGGIYASAEDVFRFARALAAGELMKPETRERMFNPSTAYPNPNYRYGWESYDTPFGSPQYSHGGGGKGFSTLLAIVPAEDLIIVVLANYRFPIHFITNDICTVLKTGSVPPVRPFDTFFLVRTFEESHSALSVDQLREALTGNGYSMPRSPWGLIRAADALAKFEDWDRAINLYRLNTELFPKEAAPWNALAETYRAKGDTREAIRCFRRALETSPGDGYAAMRLKELEN